MRALNSRFSPTEFKGMTMEVLACAAGGLLLIIFGLAMFLIAQKILPAIILCSSGSAVWWLGYSTFKTVKTRRVRGVIFAGRRDAHAKTHEVLNG